MIRDARAGIWTETALFATASVLLAQMGLGVFLFLIPLQILYVRRGLASLLAAGGGAVVAIAAIRLIGAATRQALEQSMGVLLVEIVAVAALVLGLILVNAYDGRPLPLSFLRSPLRAVPRLLGATGVVAALCAPVALLIGSRTDIGGSIEQLFRDAALSIASALAQGSRGLTGTGIVDATALASRMYGIAVEILPRSVLLYYFGILTFSWWAGRRSAARASRMPPPRLVAFAMPDGYVWPLIGSLALVLADIAFGIGVVSYAGWNVGLIMLFLYGLQGLGIVQFAFARYSVGRTLRLLSYVVLVVLFLSPGANLVVVIGLPGLGVSEIWLKYRTRRRKANADEGDS